MDTSKVETKVYLTKMPTKNAKKRGTLVTILNCALTKEHDLIDCREFDKFFSAYGSVEKPTEYQRYRETPNLNGNRYLVLHVENLETIPSSVVIGKFRFYTRFKGQKWKCFRCVSDHVGPCPYLQSFYEAKKKREELSISHKVYADSTLRRVECVGLKTDVLCVPGGGLGDIANAIAYDSALDSLEEITIVGGINDVLSADLPDVKSYGHCVELSLGKIQKIAEVKPNIKRVNIIPTVTDFDGLPSVQAEDRLGILQSRVEEFASKIDTISVKNLNSGLVTFEKDKLHPDESGTVQILHQLHELFQHRLIWNDDFITNRRLYNGVETSNKFGCKTCWMQGFFPRGRCHDCTLDADDFDAPYLKNFVNVVIPQVKRESSTSPSSASEPSQKKGKSDSNV